MKFGLLTQASREHYCIHPTVSKKTNKDEECQNLLKDDSGCKFFKNVAKLYGMQTSHFLMVLYESCFVHAVLMYIVLALHACRRYCCCWHAQYLPHSSDELAIILKVTQHADYTSRVKCRFMTLKTWQKLARTTRHALTMLPRILQVSLTCGLHLNELHVVV